MEQDESLRLEMIENHVAAITIDRPEAGNTLTLAICNKLGEIARECERNDDIRVVVLRGAGRWFCAGADMRSVDLKGQAGGAPSVDFVERYFLTHLLRLTKPLIGQINGAAAGGGFALALVCDLRIAAESAIFSTSFLRLGVPVHDMVTWLLPRIVGRARTFELCYRAGKITAQRALEIGLVSEVWPDAELQERTMDLARDIAGLAPHAVRLSKQLLAQSPFRQPEEHVIAQEFAAMSNRMVASHDIEEGVRAFSEKRKPNFRGPVQPEPKR